MLPQLNFGQPCPSRTPCWDTPAQTSRPSCRAHHLALPRALEAHCLPSQGTRQSWGSCSGSSGHSLGVSPNILLQPAPGHKGHAPAPGAHQRARQPTPSWAVLTKALGASPSGSHSQEAPWPPAWTGSLPTRLHTPHSQPINPRQTKLLPGLRTNTHSFQGRRAGL